MLVRLIYSLNVPVQLSWCESS